jgi:hypothetical protein
LIEVFMSILKYVTACALVLGLVGCGGGGGSAGTVASPVVVSTTSTVASTSTVTTPTTDATATTAVTPESTVAGYIYQLGKNTLSNSGSDSVQFSVTALDVNNNPVAGVALKVAVDSGIYTPLVGVTDKFGVASGVITIGGNKSNRNIKLTPTINNVSKTITLVVSGIQISLASIPATPSVGSGITVTIKVSDAINVGIANAEVDITGTLGVTQRVTTDQNGNAIALLGAAPATAGTYSIEASSFGSSNRKDVQVIGAGGVSIPNAVGIISAANLSVTPNNLAPNVVGQTTRRSQLRAIFRDAANQPIQNIRTRFEIVPPGLGSGEQISTAASTVYSDVGGVAIADYISGARSSPTNGVVLRVCYGSTDADIAGVACPNSRTATMTVASQPLSVSIGDNNKLATGNNGLTYIKQFDIAVNDAVGVAVPDAIISASIDITHYGKGLFSTALGTGGYQITGNTAPKLNEPGITTTAIPSFATGRVWCPNEDTNRNGFLDAGEDINGTGRLEARISDVVLSFVTSNSTNASGRLLLQVEYSQDKATWLAYTVRVTTSVAGSEGTTEKSYITNFLEADLPNGSFLIAPYGKNQCTAAN